MPYDMTGVTPKITLCYLRLAAKFFSIGVSDAECCARLVRWAAKQNVAVRVDTFFRNSNHDLLIVVYVADQEIRLWLK